jgi:hypothetical protein
VASNHFIACMEIGEFNLDIVGTWIFVAVIKLKLFFHEIEV